MIEARRRTSVHRFGVAMALMAPAFAHAGSATWTSPSGNYSTASSWTPATVPNGSADVATFTSQTPDTNVNVNLSPTLYGLKFTGASTFTLSGASTITLSDGATIDGQSGFPVIYPNLSFAGGGTIHTAVSGLRMYLFGNVASTAPNTTVTKTGPGLLILGSNSTWNAGAGSSLVVSGGTLELSGKFTGNLVVTNAATASIIGSQSFESFNLARAGSRAAYINNGVVVKTRSVSIGGGTTLDLRNGTLLVDYGAEGNSQSFGQLSFFLKQAVQNGQTGTGVISSTAAANPAKYAVGLVEANSIGSPSTFLGTTIDTTTTIARYTLRGDGNLDGTVNFDDLLRLAKAYNKAGTWIDGDSDYSGTVDFGDLLTLAKNYNGSLAPQASFGTANAAFTAGYALAASLVPEPAAAMFTLLGTLGAIASQRRRLPATIDLARATSPARSAR